MKKLLLQVLMPFFISSAIAQNVGIGTTTPDVAAQLDISASNKGLLIPRVQLTGNTDVVTVPSPTRSLLVYNTLAAGSGAIAVMPGFYYWNGTTWEALAVTSGIANSAWSLSGNNNTNPNLNFIGTTDNQSLMFKINNNNAGYLGTTGNSFWGISSGNSFSTGDNNTAIGAHSLANITSGFSNVALGNDALRRSTTRSNLVAVGDSALFNNGFGAVEFSGQAKDNTAVGSKALWQNTIGYGNTATGYLSQAFNTSGYENTSSGHRSLFQNTTGYKNSALGLNALYSNTTGFLNTAIGYSALEGNVSGSWNVGIGYNALLFNKTGYSNVVVGSLALMHNTAESNIVAIGDSALHYYTGNNSSLPLLFGNNTAVGSKALYNSTIGTSNSAFGSQTLYSNQTGNFNVAVGGKSLYANTTGGGNVAVGVNSMQQNTSGDGNIAVGRGALYGGINSSGDYNIAIGVLSLMSNVSGGHNIAIGTAALDSATNATSSVAIGDSAMYSFKGGGENSNIALGSKALFSNVNAGGNTAIGHGTLYKNKGGGNTAVGDLTLYANDFGINNTGTGVFSLYNSYGDNNSAIGGESMLNNSRGDDNTALGYTSLRNNTLGNKNVAIGKSSLASNTIGSKNTVIGFGSDVSTANLLNATAIGAEATVACSSCMVLGSIAGLNGASTNTKVGIGTSSPQTTLHVSPNAAGSILIGANKTSGGYTNLEMGINTQSGGYGYIQSTKASGSSGGDLVLNQNGGNVGIGVTAPQTDLHVNPNGAGSILIGTNKNSGGYTNLEMGITSLSGGKGYIQSTNVSGTSYGDMHLNPNGGYVGINLPTASTAFAPLDIKQSSINRGLRLRNNYNSNGWDIASNGTLNFYVNGLYVLEIGQDGSYNQISDQRLKTNVVKMKTVLDKVMALKPSTYQYINNNPTHKISTGFLAQEVMPIFPELISDFKHPTDDPTDNNIYHTINYTGFGVIAIKAIQEQQIIIETQNKRIEKLERQMELLLKNK